MNEYPTGNPLDELLDTTSPAVAPHADTPDNTTISPAPAVPNANSASPEEKHHVLGTVWNVIVLVALVYLISVCAQYAFNPSEATASWPTWVNVAGYLVIIPLAAIGGAWVIMDKRWFAKRFPILARFSMRDWMFRYICLLIVLFIITSILGIIVGI